MEHSNCIWFYSKETPLPFFVKCFLWKSEHSCWSIDRHAEPKPCCYTPHICVDVTGGIWDVSEDLDSANYPLVSLVLRYANSPLLFPGRSVVCSWFKGGKLLQPVANLAKEFMNLESLNSYRILEITNGKGLWSIIRIHMPKQDCFM